MDFTYFSSREELGDRTYYTDVEFDCAKISKLPKGTVFRNCYFFKCVIDNEKFRDVMFVECTFHECAFSNTLKASEIYNCKTK